MRLSRSRQPRDPRCHQKTPQNDWDHPLTSRIPQADPWMRAGGWLAGCVPMEMRILMKLSL